MDAFGTNNDFRHYFSTRSWGWGMGPVQRNKALVSEITKRGQRVTELTTHLGLTTQDNPQGFKITPDFGIPGESIEEANPVTRISLLWTAKRLLRQYQCPRRDWVPCLKILQGDSLGGLYGYGGLRHLPFFLSCQNIVHLLDPAV